MGRIMISFAMLVSAAPAFAAAEASQVPEGSSLTLLAIGVAGVLVGRHFSAKSGQPKD